MTRDADNDNGNGGPARALQADNAWQGLSHGNAALADQPAQEPLDSTSLVESDGVAEQVDQEPASHDGLATGADEAPSDVYASSQFESNRQELATPAAPMPSSHAIPIGALGISMPHRPVPAGQPLEVRRPQARSNTRRREAPNNLGGQGSEHLFNRPPSAARVQPEPSPMEKAINTKPRVPLTSQPGFLAGLVAALVCGGAYYGYLVF